MDFAIGLNMTSIGKQLESGFAIFGIAIIMILLRVSFFFNLFSALKEFYFFMKFFLTIRFINNSFMNLIPLYREFLSVPSSHSLV